ncbi:MAG: mycofactocin precursor MftA [Ilumatobacter sp.]
MDDTTIDTTIDTRSATSAGVEPEAPVDELLVEEISIDGMCGVY